MVEYVYDAYGVPTVSFPGITEGITDAEKQAIYLLGNNNPFRYRGYYFDVESGLYYLNSRYYDPVTGRFINADGYASTGQGVLAQNMFAYCLNEPICNIDVSGEETHTILFGVSAFLVGGSSYNIGVSWDDDGNIGINITTARIFKKAGGAVVGIASAGVSASYGYTDLDTIDDLNGNSINVGGSIPKGNFCVGGEGALTENLERTGYNIYAGVGVGIDVHATGSITKIKYKSNSVGGLIKNIWNSFLDWCDSL